jgi:hypothetical protein
VKRDPISGFLNKLLYYPEISVVQLKRLGVFCLTETSAAESTVDGPIQFRWPRLHWRKHSSASMTKKFKTYCSRISITMPSYELAFAN